MAGAKRGHAVLLVLLVAVCSWSAAGRLAPSPPMLKATFLDVGQGDAAVIETPGGRTLVVDAGPASGDTSQGMRTLVPFLRAEGIQKVDALLLTHPDNDHIGGALDLLDRVPVGRLLVTGRGPANAIMQRILDLAARRRIAVTTLAEGQSLDFRDGVTAAVLSPGPSQDPLADNDNSLVLRVRFRRTAILLTGDAEAGAEGEMLRERLPVGADVLKVGHHGSRTSTTTEFLAAVGPQAAVVSCGRDNVYGHPHAAVVERIEKAHARLFRTDRDGAITVTSDGDKLWIRRAVRR